ncbi:MAG TPA: sigma-54 dependent transcriptional regulator [Nitrospirota bacterium]|jgi:DNA-binding NtrC family response regulator
MDIKPRLLVVDDEAIALKNLEHVLKKEGYDLTSTQSGPQALKIIEKEEFDLVLTDLKMERVDGMQVLKRVRELHPETEVIMITGFATVDSAIDAMKGGAYHYISKPYKLDEVRKVVAEAIEKVRLKRENSVLREQIDKFRGKVRLVTQNPNMHRLLETSRQIAPTDCNIIITGESGTGKELFARYLHYMSNRADGMFFGLNCGAFTEELLANELFGHEKGAFTGADTMKKGLMEMANKGTLFLDEITEMPPSMQVKLLRVIQEKEVLRLGATESIKVDVRFIAATNRDIRDAIKAERFRQDLYFRLNVVSIHIPPLSERKDDVPLLSYYFLKKYATLMQKEVVEISQEVMDTLTGYDFPGNVRELENVIERGVALTTGNSIEMSHLPDDIKNLSIRTFRRKGGNIPTLEEQETAYIEWVLQETGGNKTAAAQILGIDRVSLWRKLGKGK